MKIFGRNDELFELMAKAAQKHASRPERPDTPVRSVSNHFGRSTQSSPLPGPESEFFEINGEALIVVEDDWEGADDPAEPIEATTGTVTQPSAPIARSETLTRVFARTFALRKDTLAIGGAFVGGLAIAMFLLGRSTASAPVETPAPQVAVVHLDDPTPAPLPSEEASLLPPDTEPASSHYGASSLAASSPRATVQRRVAQGKFDLLICYTTPKKGEQLAKWLNEDPASPLAANLSLEATSRRGSVRIKGFPARDAQMLQRIHETRDPTGGNGTFSDAQWRNAK